MKNISGCIAVILVIAIPCSAMAFWGDLPDEQVFSTGNRLSESDLQRIAGRGLPSVKTGDPQEDLSRIILWDEAMNQGVVSVNQSMGQGTHQFIALSINSVDKR